jgi:hypothetical protein
VLLRDAKNLYAINVFEQTALVLKAVFQKFSGFFSIIRVQVSGRSAGRQEGKAWSRERAPVRRRLE